MRAWSTLSSSTDGTASRLLVLTSVIKVWDIGAPPALVRAIAAPAAYWNYCALLRVRQCERDTLA
jgi:hypothetical protein